MTWLIDDICILFKKDREKIVPKKHLSETVDEMKRFNAKRRLKVNDLNKIIT